MHFWKLKKNEVWASFLPSSSLKIASYEETSPDDGKTSNTKISYGIGCKSVHFLSALLLYSSTSLVVVARTNTAAAELQVENHFHKQWEAKKIWERLYKPIKGPSLTTTTHQSMVFENQRKVSFNIASEASNVYIFEKLKVVVKQCYQIGQFQKDKNWRKIQMRHFG